MYADNKTTEVEQKLLAELQKSMLRLKFGPDLEAEYQADSEEAARIPRTLLLLLAVAMVAVTPLYDRWLLGISDEFKEVSNFIQLWVEVPALVMTLLVVLNRRMAMISQQVLLGCALVVAGGLIAQRYYGAQYGFSVPHEFPLLVIGAVIVLARVSIWAFLPCIALILVVFAGSELHAYGQNGEVYYRIISMLMMSTLLVVGAVIGSMNVRSNWLQNRLLQEQSSVDVLTGLFNRREFDLLFDRLLRSAARERKAVAILLLDIDHFKAYNDHYGHLAGDNVLRRVGALLIQEARRPMDVRARIGGEEFVAVWYDPDQNFAVSHAADILQAIAALKIRHEKSLTAPELTASGGLLYTSPAEAVNAVDLLKQADRLLYDAKERGRNQLVSNV